MMGGLARFRRRSLPGTAGSALVRGLRGLLLILMALLAVIVDPAMALADDAPKPTVYDYYSQNGVLYYSINAKARCSDNSGSATGGVALSGNDNQTKIYNYFVSELKMSAAGASGLVGNAYAESSFSPEAGAGGSYRGLFQASALPGNLQTGNEAADLAAQLKWFGDLFKSTYPQMVAALQKETDPVQAADDFLVVYERAVNGDSGIAKSVPNMDGYSASAGAMYQAASKREDYAKTFFKNNGGTVASGDSSSSSSGCLSAVAADANQALFVQWAQYLGQWGTNKNRGVRYSQGSDNCSHGTAGNADTLKKCLDIGSDPPFHGAIDCSGFQIAVVFMATGQAPGSIIAGPGGNNPGDGRVAGDAAKYFKQISFSDAKPGDFWVALGTGAHIMTVISAPKDGSVNAIDETGDAAISKTESTGNIWRYTGPWPSPQAPPSN